MSFEGLLVYVPIIGPFLVKIYNTILKKQRINSKIDWKARKKIYENDYKEYCKLESKIRKLHNKEREFLESGYHDKIIKKSINKKISYINDHPMLCDEEIFCGDIFDLAEKIKNVDFDNDMAVKNLRRLVEDQSRKSRKILHAIEEKIKGEVKGKNDN